jgi:hypothetical protein
VNPETHRDWAEWYASKGWHVFPLHHILPNGTCSCGMRCKSSGKHPRVNWKEEQTTDGKTIRDWWTRWPEANIGIATGKQSGLFVLDIDTGESIERADGSLVPASEVSLQRIESDFGELPETLTVRTGSGGQHRYFQYPGSGDYGNSVRFLPGLDIRGEGGYVVAPPSNHESGRVYEWTVRTPPIGVPPFLLEVVGDKGKDAGSLAEIEGVGEGSRNDFLTRVAGKYRGLADVDEESLVAILMVQNKRHCQPPLDIGEVVQIAHSAMRFKSNAPEATFDMDGEYEVEEKVPSIPEGADLALSIHDLMSMHIEPPEPIVHDLLDAGTGIMIAGPPNVGKSWITMHLALCLATGQKFLGKYEVENVPVLIIDEEGSPWGDQMRMDMLINGMEVGSLVNTPLYLSIGKNLKLDNAVGLATVRRMISRYNPKLVILDSLVRMGDADENTSRGMANFFAITKELMRTTGAAFLFVHHIRKLNTDKPMDLGDLIRGSGEIRAWLDTTLIVLPGETNADMEVHINKQRWKKKPDYPFGVRLLTREDESWANLGYQGEIASTDRSTIGRQNSIMTAIWTIVKEDREPTPERIAAYVGLTPSTVKEHLGVMVQKDLIKPQDASYGKGFVYLPLQNNEIAGSGHDFGGRIVGPGSMSF